MPRPVFTMAGRIVRELLRDKRTLILMLVAPLVLLSLLYALFQSNSTQGARLAVSDSVDSDLTENIDTTHIDVIRTGAIASPRAYLRQHDLDGVLTQKGSQLTLTLANSDQSKSAVIVQGVSQAPATQGRVQQVGARMEQQLKALDGGKVLQSFQSGSPNGLTDAQRQAVEKILQEANSQLPPSQEAVIYCGGQPGVMRVFPGGNPGGPCLAVTAEGRAPRTTTDVGGYHLVTDYLYGSADSTYFQTLLPVMLGFVVFFFVFLIAGIALLRERTSGTLGRVLATPVKRWEVIGGYIIGYGLVALVQTLVVSLFSVYAFQTQVVGSLGLVVLINLLLALVALSLGLLISTFASSEFQMVQFIPIVIIPQIFFSGLVPVASMAPWVQAVAKIMPLYYGADGLTGVIERGSGFAALWPDLAALCLFAGLFLALNLLVLRRYRQV